MYFTRHTSIYLASFILLMMIVHTITILYDARKLYDEYLQNNTELTKNFFNSVTQKNVQIVKVFLDEIKEDKKLLQKFKNRDRIGLQRDTMKYFKRLGIVSPHLNNIHYHLPSCESFLRMHKPEAFGDNLSMKRPMVKEVIDTKQFSYGFENGRFGAYFRVVAPLYDNDGFLGVIDFGISLESLIDELEAFNQSINLIAFPYSKDIESNFKDGDALKKHQLIKSGNYFVIGSNKIVNINQIIDSISAVSENTHKIVTVSDEYYLINSSLKIYNHKGEVIGFILNVKDIKKQANELFRTLFYIFALGAFSFSVINMIIKYGFGFFIKKNKEISDEYYETDMKLKAMNAKLNPHFLFNSLNVISEMIHIDKNTAEKSLLIISRLLHSYLKSDDIITLEKEMVFVRDYFYLQNLRFKEMHTLEEKICCKHIESIDVPKFSVQLLVENAFKHGYDGEHPLKIKIKIIETKEAIVISVSDTGVGYKDLAEGFGLQNLRIRLAEHIKGELMYKRKMGVTNFKIIIREYHEISHNRR